MPAACFQVDVETVAGSIQAGRIPDTRGQGRTPSQAKSQVGTQVAASYSLSTTSCVSSSAQVKRELRAQYVPVER
eukprot:1161235-Pelagomonas_calceolata.AAC.18